MNAEQFGTLIKVISSNNDRLADLILKQDGSKDNSNRQEKEQKKFAVVEFLHTGSVEVIPTIWLVDETRGRWPYKKSLNYTSRCIRSCVTPLEDWETLDLKIYNFSNTFKKAHAKAQKVLMTSNEDSESSSEEDSSIRKKRKPVRYCESSEDENIKKTKKQCIRPSKALTSQKKTSPVQCDISSEEVNNPVSETEYQSFPSAVPTLKESSLPKLNTGEEVDTIRIYTMMSKIFESLEEIRREVMELKNNQIRFFTEQKDAGTSRLVKEGVLFELPEGLDFPITEDIALINLEEYLKENVNLQGVLIRHFECICSGKTLSAFLLSMLRRLMIKDVATQYSRLGRKGKKSFESLSVVTNTILATASRRFPSESRQKILETFGKVLATASDWEGRKPKTVTIDSDNWIKTDECITSYI